MAAPIHCQPAFCKRRCASWLFCQGPPLKPVLVNALCQGCQAWAAWVALGVQYRHAPMLECPPVGYGAHQLRPTCVPACLPCTMARADTRLVSIREWHRILSASLSTHGLTSGTTCELGLSSVGEPSSPRIAWERLAVALAPVEGVAMMPEEVPVGDGLEITPELGVGAEQDAASAGAQEEEQQTDQVVPESYDLPPLGRPAKKYRLKAHVVRKRVSRDQLPRVSTRFGSISSHL